MLDKGAFDAVIEILKPECFLCGCAPAYFQSFQSLAEKSMPIDILTVVVNLKSRRTGDRQRLCGDQTYQCSLCPLQILRHTQELFFKNLCNAELIRISGEIIGDTYEEQH